MYKPGDYYMTCDSCGFDYRRSQMQKRWDGLWVCRNDFEQRHPQDSVRGKRDRIRVPVSRPQILPSYDDIIALAGTGVQVMDGAEGLVDGTNIILDGTPSYLIYTGTGFTVDGGSITCDGSQSADSYIVWNPLFSGNRYKVYVQLTSYTHGSFRVYSPAGADLITNGSFATDSSWTKNAGWSISSGKAVCSGAQSAVSSINQLGSYVDGESYLTTFTLSEYSAGSCFARIGSTGVGTSRTANGTYRDCLTSDTQGRIYIYCNSTFQGSVDNFSAINIKQENAEIDTDLISFKGNYISQEDYTGSSGLLVLKADSDFIGTLQLSLYEV